MLYAQIEIKCGKEKIERAEKRWQIASALANRREEKFAPQYHNPRKLTQITAKLIRWLRRCFAVLISQ